MKKRSVIRLNQAIKILEGRPLNIKFSYFLAKTKIAIKEEATALEDLAKPSEAFIEYDQKRTRLAQRLADKNEDGTIRVNNNNFVITKNLELFQEEMESLRDLHKDAIQGRKDQIKQLNDMLEEDIEIEGLQIIEYKDIPEEIEANVIELLLETKLLK